MTPRSPSTSPAVLAPGAGPATSGPGRGPASDGRARRHRRGPGPGRGSDRFRARGRLGPGHPSADALRLRAEALFAGAPPVRTARGREAPETAGDAREASLRDGLLPEGPDQEGLFREEFTRGGTLPEGPGREAPVPASPEAVPRGPVAPASAVPLAGPAAAREALRRAREEQARRQDARTPGAGRRRTPARAAEAVGAAETDERAVAAEARAPVPARPSPDRPETETEARAGAPAGRPRTTGDVAADRPAGRAPAGIPVRERMRLALSERMPLWMHERCGMGRRNLIALVVLLGVGTVFAVQHFWTGQPETVRAPEIVGARPAVTEPGPTPGPPPAVPGAPGGSVRREPAGGIVVDVGGKVRRPGVHRLPAGSRVADAVRAAGGIRPGADTRGLNQARLLADGEQVLVGVAAVATGATPPAGGPAAASAGPVALNTATAEQLDTLPGVGPVLAQHILDFRTEHGGFRSVDELREVNGIGDRRFADLKNLVRP